MVVILGWAGLLLPVAALGETQATSAVTEECLSCHVSTHPGMVGDWRLSLHASSSPREAQQKNQLERRVSSDRIPEALLDSTVGCAECHTLNADRHQDSFEHNGYQVHVVVTPADCATCHAVEAEQFGRNLMSHAYGNLVQNAVYQDLEQSTNGHYKWRERKVEIAAPDAATQADSCLYCHGTVVHVTGKEKRETDMGEMEFPRLSGWPNQGVGRINPDGSMGSCAACHARHQFAIEVARKPYTCAQCHSGPDVPAYKVYSVSKHGNIQSSLAKHWDFKAVPWKLGKDFTAPTCAACHVSLLVNDDGDVAAERSHQMNDRLPWRLFGLIYAHPHPKSADSTIIRNRAGLPLPTDLGGEPAAGYLIDANEQARRTEAMQRVCTTCHSINWVKGHWERFEQTIQTTNALTLTSTQMLLYAWDQGLARGPAHKDSLFNEAIERKWADQWLLYANSTRLSSAMAGADYGVFDQGRWFMSRTIQEMQDWLELRMAKPRAAGPAARR
jgi:uncharacterized protein with PIN domain